MRKRPPSVDAYLAALDPDKRVALEKLRKTIKAVVPRAEECISYQLPAFRLDGRVLVWYGAATNHCSFYPGGIVEAFADELADYDTSRGTIRFAADKPLPVAVVRKLVKARIANGGARPKPTRSTAARGRARRAR